jgi:vacuolar protein-sorting-associated protein 4
MLTEFLVQMDGVGRDSSGILVLAATNLPWKLDAAVRRRFQRRIHISLPDQKARTRMFEITVGDTPCDLRADDYARLGAMTEGFSGSDISTVVQEALMQPVKKIRTATHYRKVSNPLAPTHPALSSLHVSPISHVHPSSPQHSG